MRGQLPQPDFEVDGVREVKSPSSKFWRNGVSLTGWHRFLKVPYLSLAGRCLTSRPGPSGLPCTLAPVSRFHFSNGFSERCGRDRSRTPL